MRPKAQIFLSYAREDRVKVEVLYQQLSEAGFRPWMDKKDLLPGERWKSSIGRAIRRSDFFVICLSTNSVHKRGFFQKEIRSALEIWREKLESDIYLIPVRLDDCEVPDSLSEFQWLNLFKEDDWTHLVRALQTGIERRLEEVKLFSMESTPFESYDPGFQTYAYFAKRYGMGYGQLEVKCVIRSDGSAKVWRRVEVEAHSSINMLDTFLMIQGPPRPSEKRDVALLNIKSLTKGQDVSVKFLEKQGQKLSVLIEISPGLNPGERITYQMKENLPPKLYAINLTEEEWAKRGAYYYNYFGWTINRPTRKLSLKVYFPESVSPKVYDHQVRYAATAPDIPPEVFHYEEQERLPKPTLRVAGGRYHLTLDVDYPMIGLIYILAWWPPTKTAREAVEAA